MFAKARGHLGMITMGPSEIEKTWCLKDKQSVAGVQNYCIYLHQAPQLILIELRMRKVLPF